MLSFGMLIINFDYCRYVIQSTSVDWELHNPLCYSYGDDDDDGCCSTVELYYTTDTP